MFQKTIHKQKGVVLAIALIALVAMMAAAAALSNTVTTGSQFSTNRLLSYSAQGSADVGYAAAKEELLNYIGTGSALKSKEVAEKLLKQSGCYYPYAFRGSFVDGDNSFTTDVDRLKSVNPDGVPSRLKDSTPSGACTIKNDTLNEKIYYVIDLQCPELTQAEYEKTGFTKDCSYPNNLVAGTGDQTGLVVYKDNAMKILKDNETHDENAGLGIGWQTSTKVNNKDVSTFAVPLIRISVRVDGPRGTRVYRQQMVSLFQNPAKQ